jgi:lysophospholipase
MPRRWDAEERELPMAFVFDHFVTAEKLRVRWGYAAAAAPSARGTVLLLNGRTEYMEKYAEVAGELIQRGLDVYSCDWRGQGLSERLLPDSHKGHVRRFEDYLEDLDQLMALIEDRRPPLPIMLLGHSMGGHLAARLVERYPHRFDRVVMTSPMIDIQLPWFLPKPLLRRLVRLGMKQGRHDAYAPGHSGYNAKDRRFEGNLLTSDRMRFTRSVDALRDEPRLAVGGVTYGWLSAALASIDHVNSPGFARSFPVPLLMVTASEDKIVCGRAQKEFCRRAPDCRIVSIPGARHELLVETDARRAQFWRAFDRFTASGSALSGD